MPIPWANIAAGVVTFLLTVDWNSSPQLKSDTRVVPVEETDDFKAWARSMVVRYGSSWRMYFKASPNRRTALKRLVATELLPYLLKKGASMKKEGRMLRVTDPDMAEVIATLVPPDDVYAWAPPSTLQKSAPDDFVTRDEQLRAYARQRQDLIHAAAQGSVVTITSSAGPYQETIS